MYGKGIDEILTRTDNTNGFTYYYQQDHEGIVTHLTDGNGVVVEKYQYDAFGAPIIYNGFGTQISASNFGNPLLFTGRRYQAIFGIYEYRARAYHPRLGRFTSEDPKLFVAGDYNLFRYCHNDPLDLTDPMGLDAILRLDGVYFGNAVTATEFAGGKERGHMPSAYSPAGRTIQVNPDRPEFAPPSRLPKAMREAGVQVANPANKRQTEGRITDVGPYNTRDNYWDKRSRPIAEKQFAQKIPAQDGRVPDQPAGIDATPKAMNDLGAQGPENQRTTPVIWWFKDEPFSGFKPFQFKPPDASQIEEKAKEEGARNAAEKNSNMLHSLNPKPQ